MNPFAIGIGRRRRGGALVLAAAVAAAAAPAPAADDPLELTLAEAALLALEHNAAFRVERLNPALRRTDEQAQRAAFDPAVSAEVGFPRERLDGGAATGAAGEDERRSGWRAEAGVVQTLPAGTRLSLAAEREALDTAFSADTADRDRTTTRYEASLEQPLLRGFGRAANVALLRQARLDTRISEYAVLGAAEALVAAVERSGWDYVLAGRRIEIYEESLRLAEEQRNEVLARIEVGRLPDIERAAVEAEVAQRHEDLINARSRWERARLELARVIGFRDAARWTRAIAVRDDPSAPAEDAPSAEAVAAAALERRPDLNEARLRIERGEVEIVRTRNGWLPRLDAFIALGNSRYAESFGAGGSDDDGETAAFEAGLRFEYALGARRERAARDRARIETEQAREALANIEDLAQVEVRSAHIELLRARDQIEATRATRRHREEAVRAETEKLRVGRTTSLLVAQAQRDLVAARITETEAAVAHRQAWTELYRRAGTLLERRGIRWDGAPSD